MKKALLKVGYSCNHNCIFCHSRPLRRRLPRLGAAELKARISLAGLRGAQMVVFSGGEPTLRPDIEELARYAGGLGLRVGLATNGRRLVYKDFLARLQGAGLRFVYLSFHSSTRQGHRDSSGTDSFHEVLAALGNLVRAGIETTVNTVVTRNNIGELPRIVDLLAACGPPAKIKLSAAEPKGAALENGICPPLKDAAAAIASALRYGRSRYPEQAFGSEGLTPCLLDDFESLRDDLGTNSFFLFQEAFERDFFAPDNANRGKPSSCADCAQEERCPGVYSGYLEGLDGALRPDRRPRSNSFVYAPSGPSAAMPDGVKDCPGREADARTIFLARGRRLRPHRTPTADFPVSEIEALRARGQLYAAARSRRLDFDRDLVKLRPAAACSSCDRGAGCSRIYYPSPERVHARFERAVEEVVRDLRGAVLDVGCGSVRFRGVIAGLARIGAVRYVGIDPALPSLRAGPGMRLARRSIEEFAGRAGSFDRILLLRSYNHLAAPSIAFPKMRRLLKPDGRLVVVDGTAFGLVLPRAPRPAKPGEFEHHRNHDSLHAAKLLKSFGFAVLREIPATAEGANEWLLELGK